MTIADSRVVAWEYRTLNAVDGWSMWSKCTEADFQSLCKSHYSATVEVRELVPLSLLAEAESAHTETERDRRRWAIRAETAESLLAEAESASERLDAAYLDAWNHAQNEKDRADALQSRLDAVGRLADELAKRPDVMAADISKKLRSAALGGESRGDGEVES